MELHTAPNTFSPLLTPQGHLHLAPEADAPPLPLVLHEPYAAVELIFFQAYSEKHSLGRRNLRVEIEFV